MSTQFAFFPDDYAYSPPSGLATLIETLLNLPPRSKVLVVELGHHITNLFSSQGHEVVRVQSDLDLGVQIDQLCNFSPYDGAVIMPIFAAQQPYVAIPEGWGDLKKTFTEDWLIAYAVNNVRSLGALVALVPNGLLSNYGRKNLRKGLVEKGLALVASMPHDLWFDYFKLSSTGLILLRKEVADPHRPIVFFTVKSLEDLIELQNWERIASGDKVISSRNFTMVLVPAKDLGDEYRGCINKTLRLVLITAQA